MPRRKHKIYSRPRKAFDKARIEEEDKLIKEYGLKSKREIWKAESYANKMRKQAKEIITKPDKQKILFDKLNKKGFNVKKIADILALQKEDILKRRLQTIIVKKNLSKTPKHARQLIVHKHVFVGSKVVNAPSYIVELNEEKNIKIK